MKKASVFIILAAFASGCASTSTKREMHESCEVAAYADTATLVSAGPPP